MAKTGPVADPDLAAYLCTYLPALIKNACEYRWAQHLDAAIKDVRAGTPITQALANHDLSDLVAAARDEQAHISRGDPGTLDDLNLDPVAVPGAYTCPAPLSTARCTRRDQPDPDGHEPRCEVHGLTMTPRDV